MCKIAYTQKLLCRFCEHFKLLVEKYTQKLFCRFCENFKLLIEILRKFRD